MKLNTEQKNKESANDYGIFNHKLEEQKTIEQILKLAQEIENRKKI